MFKVVQKVRKKLRTGYTTGACAAAAAKAATTLLMSSEFGVQSLKKIKTVEIPFPDGSRVSFEIHNSELTTHDSKLVARASIIKDAGDDPDITNGAEIVAEAAFIADCRLRNADSKNEIIYSEFRNPNSEIKIKGGKGVGIVTKPGLPVPVGEPAINPVPRKMIREAVMEAISECGMRIVELKNPKSEIRNPKLEVTISVPDGENLAKKTLNSRLGIIGGTSILGTTGIVKPISSEAWTATITASIDVAKAMGHDEIVLSAGRASEKAHMKKYNLSEESYVMMGDYLEFSLLEAKRHEFKKIHLCAQWAKMLKIAMSTPQTHVRHGAIDIKKAVEFLKKMGQGAMGNGQELWRMVYGFNTAREIFDLINSSGHKSFFSQVCNTAKGYAERIASGIPVVTHLISYEGDIIATSE